jgi:hypothetical protein
MAEQAQEQTYFGLTLSQHRERLKKLAAEKGLQGEVLERITAKALEMIPTIRLDESTQR